MKARLAITRPTTSTGLDLQQAGRILRPWNDARAIILDHAGCVAEHGLQPFACAETLKWLTPKMSANQVLVCALPLTVSSLGFTAGLQPVETIAVLVHAVV